MALSMMLNDPHDTYQCQYAVNVLVEVVKIELLINNLIKSIYI